MTVQEQFTVLLLDERDHFEEALRWIAVGRTGGYGSTSDLAKAALDHAAERRQAAKTFHSRPQSESRPEGRLP